MKKLKVKIPKKVIKGSVFTLSSGDYEENSHDCVMQAMKDFNLIESINDWKVKNTTSSTDKHYSLNLELNCGGVDFLQYLKSENLAKVLTFFDLHDRHLYSDNSKSEIGHSNWSNK